MNYKNILNKNNIEFKTNNKEKIIVNEIIDKINDKEEIDYDTPDDRFDLLYSNKLSSISVEFKELIKELGLPYLNKRNINYNLYDFIKYNSNNYKIIVNNYEKELNNMNDNESYEEDDYIENNTDY